MENRITKLFQQKREGILNIFFTAGFPGRDDTVTILQTLEKAGADMAEIGMPYSDPLADGPTIQRSNETALANGMHMKLLFEQLAGIRGTVSIPLLLMGYLNPVMQYGVENFCKKAAEVGIDGVILPDLPVDEYNRLYRDIFEAHHLSVVFLITPNTPSERVRMIDESSDGFIYVVSTESTTGSSSKEIGDDHVAYFKKIRATKLKNPTLIGFNIKDRKSYKTACQYANGAIIGSAFINRLSDSPDLKKGITEFVASIRG